MITITVHDNGPGYPEKILKKKTDSIGLHLIEKLTQKLGGTFQFKNESGAFSKITFTPERGNI